MLGSIPSKLGDWYRRTVHFFGEEIWKTRLDELPPKVASRYRMYRVAQRTLQGLIIGNALHVRAAALTYFTVLSLVPLLAFAFALLKGFGAYEVLVEDTIRPYMLSLFSGNDALRDTFDRILGFVEATGVASLGFIGLLALLYAATRLLHNIEEALNEIWGASRGRETLQQLRDYVSIIVITPLCLVGGAALTTAGQALRILRQAGETLGVSTLVDQLIGILGPLLAVFVGLLFLYKAMPYTFVRVRSAMLGAAVGAVLWYCVLLVHVRFQVGVAQYNALYSSFAAVPIFLAWLHVSWLVVLVGAQAAATHQNDRAIAQRSRLASADQALKESICLAAVLNIATRFLQGQPPATAQVLSADLDVDEPLVREVLDKLIARNILVHVEPVREHRYVLAQAPERIHVKDVLDALRRSDPAQDMESRARIGRVASQLWHELDRELASSPANRTLRDVVEEPSMREAALGRPRAEPAQVPPATGGRATPSPQT